MPTIACPCCRAANDIGPNCRRCSADLSLLFQLEANRAAFLQAAESCIARDAISDALQWLSKAEALRTGEDLHRLRAMANLANLDFQTAFDQYRLATRS